VKDRSRPLDFRSTAGLITRGGTILGTSNKDNPFHFYEESEDGGKPADRSRDVLRTIRKHRLNGLVAIGGDGTMAIASSLGKLGVKIVGVPKTIDNDLPGTDVTFGFNSAVTTAMEAIDKIHDTATSHHRVMVIEVMGRYAGWIALAAGLSSGVEVILIPEIPLPDGKGERRHPRAPAGGKTGSASSWWPRARAREAERWWSTKVVSRSTDPVRLGAASEAVWRSGSRPPRGSSRG